MSHRKHPHEHGADGRGAEKPAEPPAPGAGQAQPPEGTAPDQLATLEAQLAAKTEECRQLVDQLQRVAAEYSNYQKRMARQMEEAERYAGQTLVLDLLPVIDNFERALAAAKTEADFKALRDGVQLVHDQILAALGKHGVSQVQAHGEEFNPEHHEAIAQLPSGEHGAGKVAEVVQKGYKMHGRTIRPSRVVISSGPAAEGGEPAENHDKV